MRKILEEGGIPLEKLLVETGIRIQLSQFYFILLLSPRSDCSLHTKLRHLIPNTFFTVLIFRKFFSFNPVLWFRKYFFRILIQNQQIRNPELRNHYGSGQSGSYLDVFIAIEKKCCLVVNHQNL